METRSDATSQELDLGLSPNPLASARPMHGIRPDGRAPWTLYSSQQRWVLLSVLFLVTMWNYFDYYVISIVLDPIKKEFQVSDTMLGLLSGFAFATIYAFAALPVARWADRGNRRTIITITLSAWSLMTALCGIAQNFSQLLIARLGVALTEPGGAPPAQSLAADYFPPERRATAISVLLQGGSALGYGVAIAFGGYIAATYGWRTTFLMAGAPGLLLAVATHFMLREPRQTLGFPASSTDSESAKESIAILMRRRSFVFTVAGITFYCLFAYGTSVFLPSFMIRSLHATLAQVSVTWGIAVTVAMVIGALIGGPLADWLSRANVRWYAWLPCLAFGIGCPMYWLTLSSPTLWTFIFVDFPSEIVLAVGFSVSFSAIHPICGSARRASAVALVYFCVMFIGCGFGPLMAGAISDALTPTYGNEGLRYGTLMMVLFLIPASLSMFFAGRAMPQDLED